MSRRDPNVCKNDFGHVLVVAGSPFLLGASALTGLAVLRCGAGLVTVAVPQSLNLTLQKKISPVIMTLGLPQTREQTFAVRALPPLKKIWNKFDAVAIGPGMGKNKGTQKFIRDFITVCPRPMVIDADALNALANRGQSPIFKIKIGRCPPIITPHPGEMARLTGLSVKPVEKNRKAIALDFAQKNHCVVLLKGHRTIVASPEGKVYVNRTGNAGMATAGSGDVLTGMIAALLGQGMGPFEAAKIGAYLHGRAGDLAAKTRTKAGMIAADIIEFIPKAVKERQK
ncbi:MAG: NAD(P)H-hydrate dehydratase [Candidatus Omnitrophica bacterium]|nr:NAD(P)H-hydrate dehydratase [Candidatus Omnitrophota bacterium]